MSVSAERKLGERVARELYRDPDYIDDPVLDEYVLDIWNRLLAAARARGELTAELDDRFAWQVLLGKDRVINAFAVPGGWMGVQLGLINVTATRDELAAVLAHELSHVTQRHHSRLMTQQNQQAPWLIGAMILAALAASKNPDAANAMVAGGQAMAMQNQLNFSRDMEREADRVGFGVMTQAGFAPQGFVTMFEKLQQAARLNDNGNFPYLRTHPMTTERIAEGQSRQQLADRAAAAPGPDLVHAMMVGRSRVLSNPGVDNLRSYASRRRPTGRRQCRPRAAGRRCCTPARWPARSCASRRPPPGWPRKLGRSPRGDAHASRLATLAGRRSRAAGRRRRARRLAGGRRGRRPAGSDAVRRRRGMRSGRAARGGAAPADLGGAAPARRRGLAAAGRGVYRRRARGCARSAPRPKRRSPGSITRRRWTASRPRRTSRARRAPAATTSRRRSSTPARGRWSYFFANRPSSADSITTPSTV